MTTRDGEVVEIAKAKGRPMLSSVGKRPLREVQAFPSQLVERFAPETPDGIVAGDVDWTEWPEGFDPRTGDPPGDEHDVVVVGLGRELSTVAWLERHNRTPIYRIRLIDLRTDKKHGRSLEHHPATLVTRNPRDFERLGIRVLRYA